MNYISQLPNELVEAHLTSKQKKLKNYNNNFYLKDKQEFELEFFNKHSQEIAVEVSYNNVTMLNRLVIRPGERIWLERFLEDNKKLMFETYTVDKEAKEYIKDNGNLVLDFYHKTTPSITYTNVWPSYPNPYYWPYTYPSYSPSHTFTTDSSTLTVGSSTANNIANTVNFAQSNQQIETGRITKGKKSNQELVNTYENFSSLSFKTIEYKLLPYSQKVLGSKDIRKYCSNCGIRIRKQTWEFCPKCGTKT